MKCRKEAKTEQVKTEVHFRMRLLEAAVTGKPSEVTRRPRRMKTVKQMRGFLENNIEIGDKGF